MKTLLLLVLSFVVLAACGGDEFSTAREGVGVAGEAAAGTGGATDAAGAGGEPVTGGTTTGGSAAFAGSGGAAAGTGGATETGATGGARAGTGGSDTGGATAGGSGGAAGGLGGAPTGGSGGTPPVVFEEPRPLCGKTPKGGVCERVVANGSDTTCEADGHCWCPTGSVLCRDTRFPLEQQLMCQRGTTCAQPKTPLEVSCTHDNQCGSGSLCDERLGIQVCFCSTSTSKVCRSATGNITCTAAGTPCAY